MKNATASSRAGDHPYLAPPGDKELLPLTPFLDQILLHFSKFMEAYQDQEFEEGI